MSPLAGLGNEYGQAMDRGAGWSHNGFAACARFRTSKAYVMISTWIYPGLTSIVVIASTLLVNQRGDPAVILSCVFWLATLLGWTERRLGLSAVGRLYFGWGIGSGAVVMVLLMTWIKADQVILIVR